MSWIVAAGSRAWLARSAECRPKVADLYGGIDGLPTTFFLDRDGKVVDRVLGLEDESLLEASIKKSLGQGDSSTNASAK